MKNTERFSNRADYYVQSRPHYPPEIIPFLNKTIGLKKDWSIADIGSGTGISAELFLENGNKVYAVEPNREMREFAEHAFKNNPQFRSVNAKAEATTLPDHSVDMITASQAFHWFDRDLTKKEFQRIAKKGADLVLIWNIRNLDSKLQQAYDEMLHKYAPGYADVGPRNANEGVIRDFFAPLDFKMHSFSNFQILNYEGLKGRLLSTSYVPLEGDPNHKPIMECLQKIFNEFNDRGQITFEYICKLYYGKIL